MIYWKLLFTLAGSLAGLVYILCYVHVMTHYQNLTPFTPFTPSLFYNKTDKIWVERKNEFIPGCNCSRKNYYYVEGQTPRKRLMSFCSDPGTFFQPSQKVISYSLYLPKSVPPKKWPNPKSFYIEGILKNLRTMRLHYPTYTMRLYTDVKTDPQFCFLICNNPDLFWCDIRAFSNLNLSKVFPMVWRVLPLGDPTVDHFLSRDLDSILTEREAAVVADWLSLPEKKAFHVMRDRKNDHNSAILGGMWGASNSLLGDSGNQNAGVLILVSILNDGLKEYQAKNQVGFDQGVLRSNIFYPLKDKIVAYDSYHCQIWRKYTMVRPFPMKRKNNSTDFVGNVNFGQSVYRMEKCPVECRPEYGKDWEWC